MGGKSSTSKISINQLHPHPIVLRQVRPQVAAAHSRYENDTRNQKKKLLNDSLLGMQTPTDVSLHRKNQVRYPKGYMTCATHCKVLGSLPARTTQLLGLKSKA